MTCEVSQWPRGLRRGSETPRLLWLWFSNSARGMGVSLVNVVCCQVEVSASGWSLVQRNPVECGVSECDREASIMRRPWPTRGCCDMKTKTRGVFFFFFFEFRVSSVIVLSRPSLFLARWKSYLVTSVSSTKTVMIYSATSTACKRSLYR
jgi:hypothetical protein